MTDQTRGALGSLFSAAKVAGAVVVLVGAAAMLRAPACWALTAMVVPDARAQAVEVVAPVKADVEKLKADIEQLKVDVTQTKLETVRTGTMVEMLLRIQGVHPPPPVPAPDGGAQ